MLSEIFELSFTELTSNSELSSSLPESRLSSTEFSLEISFLREKYPNPAATAAKNKNSWFGIPGTRPRARITSEVGPKR